eukprot:COSAG04_NODE_529_length_13029_cov_3.203248_10_plen_752_part_00
MAVAAEQEAAVRFLLERGADPSLANSSGRTPLMAAASKGNQPIMQLLLEAKADLHAVDPANGFTAFHDACVHNQPDCADALVRAGCDTAARNKHGETGRDLAEQKGHTALLERLNRLDPVRGLVEAAKVGDQEELSRLIDSGCDINALTSAVIPVTKDESMDATALHVAVFYNQKAAARLLLGRGANPNLASSRGTTSLMDAAMLGFSPILRLLLEAQADIDALDQETGDTAFTNACFYGASSCVEVLMLAGCDKSLRTKAGKMGRDLAVQNKQRGVLLALKRLNQSEPQRKLTKAARDGDLEELSKLVEGGCKMDTLVKGVLPSAENKDVGAAALYVAVAYDQEAVVRLLLDRRADPNLACSVGATPLMLAAAKGFSPILQLLVEAGADIDAVDPKHNDTAFHLACLTNRPDCAEALVRAGCDTTVRGKDDETGRDLAEQKGHTAVLERLDAIKKKTGANRKKKQRKRQKKQAVATQSEPEPEPARPEEDAAEAKARRKREKRKRQQEKKRALAAQAAEPELGHEPEPEAEPEPEPESEPEPKPEPEPEPKPEPELEPKPEPEPEPESAEERAARERSAQLSRLQALPMAEWSSEQVLEWTALIDLPPGCAEAVGTLFAHMEFDGDDLSRVHGKMLVKQLAKLGAEDPQLAVRTLLRERDSVLAGRTEQSSQATDCPLCFERYRDDECGRRVPRSLQCGHSACQGCYALMLQPINADGNVKRLECPECRVVTAVPRGRAESLQKNFALLR